MGYAAGRRSRTETGLGDFIMRAFIAIDFDDAVIRQLADLQTRLRQRLPSLKWVRPDQLHLTVKFLGEMDDSRVAEIGEALTAIATNRAPFAVRLKSVGCFGPRGSVRIIWVGVKDATGALQRLAADCDAAMASLGFPREERPFSAHLTLARNKNPHLSRDIHRAIEGDRNAIFGEQTIAAIALYQSELDSTGPTYTTVSNHPFLCEPEMKC